MPDWTCRCSAKNGARDRYCEGCGAENPRAPARTLEAPKVPEMQRPWTPPTYPAPAPGDDALIRAEIARARALLAMPPKPEAPRHADADTSNAPARLGLAIDPAIRAELARRNAAGPEPVGAVLPSVLPAR